METKVFSVCLFFFFHFLAALFVPVLRLLILGAQTVPLWVGGPSDWDQPWQIKFTCNYLHLPIFIFLAS